MNIIPNDPDISNASFGTSLKGYLSTPWSFEETIARLLGAGFVMQETDEYKVSVEFYGSFDGQPFTLYDYKGDRQIHIGGGDRLKVSALNATLVMLLSAATPVPYSAREHYDECDGCIHSWTAPCVPAPCLPPIAAPRRLRISVMDDQTATGGFTIYPPDPSRADDDGKWKIYESDGRGNGSRVATFSSLTYAMAFVAGAAEPLIMGDSK